MGGGGGWGMMTLVLTATMPKILAVKAFLPLYTTYCRRMIDVTHCYLRACLARACPNHWYLQRFPTLYNIPQKYHVDDHYTNVAVRLTIVSCRRYKPFYLKIVRRPRLCARTLVEGSFQGYYKGYHKG